MDDSLTFLFEEQQDYILLDTFILYIQETQKAIKDKYLSKEELDRKREGEVYILAMSLKLFELINRDINKK